METTLTEAELAAGLREALERVRGGERVVVERDGQAIAVLAPRRIGRTTGLSGNRGQRAAP